MAAREFIAKGLPFECTACGKCCVNHGEYEHVFLTRQDISRISEKLKLTRKAFLALYTRREQEEHALESRGDRCVFLGSGGLCRVYEVRPLQCRTFPFWPENLNPKTWNGSIANDCPGVGSEVRVPRARIATYLSWMRREGYPE